MAARAGMAVETPRRTLILRQLPEDGAAQLVELILPPTERWDGRTRVLPTHARMVCDRITPRAARIRKQCLPPMPRRWLGGRQERVNKRGDERSERLRHAARIG